MCVPTGLEASLGRPNGEGTVLDMDPAAAMTANLTRDFQHVDGQ